MNPLCLILIDCGDVENQLAVLLQSDGVAVSAGKLRRNPEFSLEILIGIVELAGFIEHQDVRLNSCEDVQQSSPLLDRILEHLAVGQDGTDHLCEEI